LNVNYPNIPADEIKGVCVTRLGIRWYDDVIHERVDPRGSKYYWISGKKILHGKEPGTDSYELDRGCISVTPLTLDMTRRDKLEAVTSVLTESIAATPSDGWRPHEVIGPNQMK
jgi:5'-nucleotidase